MTYFQSAKGVQITQARALKELRDHGVCDPEDFDLFFHDLGKHDTYSAQDVLAWLGY